MNINFFRHRSNWMYFMLSCSFGLSLYLAHAEMSGYFIVSILGSFILLTFIFLFMLAKLRKQQSAMEKQKNGIESQTKELVSLGEELFSLNEEKNRVLNALSHDLRNPINQVMGIANLLKNQMDELTKQEQAEFLSKMIGASERQLDMIEKLLDISAIELMKSQVTLHSLDLVTPLKKVIQSQTMFANPKGLKINLDVKTHKSKVKADLNYINQIFENLLSNAIKFSPPGKQIFIELAEQNGCIVTSFIDEGPGLTNEDIPKLFKTFSKLSARPTAGESSVGLGLSLVRGYAKLMGGKVGYIQRGDNQGAHFYVSFNKIKEDEPIELEQ